MATQGYRYSHVHESYRSQDEALSALDNMQDPASGAPPPSKPDCKCGEVCENLHEDRIPKEVQVSATQLH